MKNTIRALALSLALLPALAAAQVPNTPTTLPANTVVGRLGVTAGPAQAIPFARFQSAVSGPCATATAGLVPATGGGTANFLRADCTFESPLPTIANNQIVANISGSTAQAAAATPTSIWDAFCSTTIGNIWVRQTGGWGCLAVGYANPVWWGADPTGAIDSAAALNSAIATGLPIRWPSGAFKINSQITTTLSTYTSCFCMSGAGAGMTTLNWPNATGGIQVTGTTTGGGGFSHNRVDISDLKISTSQAGGGNAIKLLNGGNVNTPISSIRNAIIQGDDYNQGSGSKYWNVDIYDHNWPNVIIDSVQMNGNWAYPNTGSNGIGVLIEGDTPTASYTQSIKLMNSNIGYHTTAVELRSYWQGVLIGQTNMFGANVINVPAGQLGTLVQLGIVNSIFYGELSALTTATNVLQMQLIGNNVIVDNDTGGASGGFLLGPSVQAVVIGNIIAGLHASVATNGIATNAANGLFIGNQFSNLATGILMQGSSSNTSCIQNIYSGTTNDCVSSGAGNSVGVVTR